MSYAPRCGQDGNYQGARWSKQILDKIAEIERGRRKLDYIMFGDDESTFVIQHIH